MKSYRKANEEPRERTYPCLMECTHPNERSMIVLFHEEGSGTVVLESPQVSGNHRLGYHSESWDMNCYKPFTGTVVLEG